MQTGVGKPTRADGAAGESPAPVGNRGRESSMTDVKAGIDLISAERARQISKEGWTPEHDDEHTDQSLATVAGLYALPEAVYLHRHTEGYPPEFFDPWPRSWADEYDRRGDYPRIRELVIAGALIAAEIDRILRAESKEGKAA